MIYPSIMIAVVVLIMFFGNFRHDEQARQPRVRRRTNRKQLFYE